MHLHSYFRIKLDRTVKRVSAKNIGSHIYYYENNTAVTRSDHLFNVSSRYGIPCAFDTHEFPVCYFCALVTPYNELEDTLSGDIKLKYLLPAFTLLFYSIDIKLLLHRCIQSVSKEGDRWRSLENWDRSAQIDDPETEQIKPFIIPLSDTPRVSLFATWTSFEKNRASICKHEVQRKGNTKDHFKLTNEMKIENNGLVKIIVDTEKLLFCLFVNSGKCSSHRN